ncbi:hypothetical protein R6Z07M_016015 [Ovis aries]
MLKSSLTQRLSAQKDVLPRVSVSLGPAWEPLVLLGEKDQAGGSAAESPPGVRGSLISPLTATSSFRGFRLSGLWTETVSPVSWGKGDLTQVAKDLDWSPAGEAVCSGGSGSLRGRAQPAAGVTPPSGPLCWMLSWRRPITGCHRPPTSGDQPLGMQERGRRKGSVVNRAILQTTESSALSSYRKGDVQKDRRTHVQEHIQWLCPSDRRSGTQDDSSRW